MSKAFTREMDMAGRPHSSHPQNDEADDEAGPSAHLPAGAKNYITPGGYLRLKEELEQLWKVERPALVQTVSWAASNGDRSENGDYIYGKKRLREIDRRIRFLTKRLDHVLVVDPTAQDNTDQVFFGATVTVADEAGATATYSIVGLDEADPGRGRISWVSPLARALLKARQGDSVRFLAPAGVRELEIVAIEYRVLD